MKLGNRELLLLGQHLADCRRAADLSQPDVASELDLDSAQYISNFERGVCAPSVATLQVLLELYKIPKKSFIMFYQGLFCDRIKELLGGQS